MKKYYSMIVLILGLCLSISFGNAAKMYLVSENNALLSNCENNIDVMIDTQGEEIFGAAATMSYDRNNIEIIGLYLNNDFNLPLAVNIEREGGEGRIKSAELSLIRNVDYDQTGFKGVVKYGTLVIKNKEPIENTEIDFLFDGAGSTIDNMDVFRLGDARDVLSSVEGKKFDFVEGVCMHDAPNGDNQLDESYDFQSNLDKNLQNIENVEKIYKFRLLFMDYGVYGLMLILLFILLFVMRKKGLFKNKKVLADKENKNV